MKTIVDRRTWLRGPYALTQGSCLLNEMGMKCCLGFRLEQGGIESKFLQNKFTPAIFATEGVLDKDTWLVKKGWRGFEPSLDALEAMEVNDDIRTTDEFREEVIKKIFEKNGEEIEFVGPRLTIVNGAEVTYEDVEAENENDS